jgi:hypothetical protein
LCRVGGWRGAIISFDLLGVNKFLQRSAEGLSDVRE